MSKRLALIIGNSIYRDTGLARLNAPDADVGALADVLMDPEVGGFEDVKLLVNMSSTAVRRSISDFFSSKGRDDLLLLYFSGHGVLDDQGRLYLAVKDTERKLLRATGISAAFITDEMNNSRSQREVLILDCCHSGAFARGSKGETGASVGTAKAFEGTGYGRVVLTATDATQYAWEGERIIGGAESSLFTHLMIQGITNGAADLNGDGRITLDELYDYVYEQVVKQTPKQTPGKWSFREQGEIIIAQAPIREASIPSIEQTVGQDEFAAQFEDEKIKAQVDQLYTRGLAAYHLEEWQKAISYFGEVLQRDANHSEAAAKLEEAQRYAQLMALDEAARQAEEKKEWEAAVAFLESLLEQAPDYKDVSVRLEQARRQKKLADLYAEAQQLLVAGEWEAVCRAFGSIAAIDADYPDPEGVLPAAQQKLEGVERQQRLDELFRNALIAVEADRWKEAEQLLTQVVGIEPGDEDAKRLLEKAGREAQNQRAAEERQKEIEDLYREASLLASAGEWTQSLKKMEIIFKLELDFPDPKRIAAQAQEQIDKENARKEQEIALRTLYAEAVQLNQAGQYQQALEMWQQIRDIEVTYPDSEKVEATARKKLKDLAKPTEKKLQIALPRRYWLAAGGLLAIFIIVGASYIYAAFFSLPEQTCIPLEGFIVSITSNKLRSQVAFDGRITSDSEWKDAGCYDLKLNREIQNELETIPTRLYIKNDQEWLYLMVKVPIPEFEQAIGAGLAYFWPYPYENRWKYSDSGSVTFDMDDRLRDDYHWDGVRWYPDASSLSGAKNNTEGMAGKDEMHYFFEFRKPLASGESEDWLWQPGETVGSEISGDLLLIVWNEDTFYAHHLWLTLSE